METQIENTQSKQHSWFYILGEILLVFLPAILMIELLSPWVGKDVFRGTGVIWGTYVIMFAMVWTGKKLRGESWRDFGLTLNRVTFTGGLRTFGLSLIVFVIASIAYLLGPVIISIFTDIQPDADFRKYDFLKDNFGALILSLTSAYLISSFGEEVIFRAFLINRISEWAIATKYNNVIAVLLSSVCFGFIHYEWGPMGMIQTGCMGLVMGIFYVTLKRKLWVLVLAHAYMDTLLFVQLYLANN